VDLLPLAITLRQVAPRDARAVSIDHGIDEQAVVSSGATDVAFAPRQEVLDLQPLIIAKGVAVHVSASLPTPHESETN
jgi:hypothetical protein